MSLRLAVSYFPGTFQLSPSLGLGYPFGSYGSNSNPSINGDSIPLPPPRLRRDEDDALLEDYPWIDTPIKVDYGYNVRYVTLSANHR